MALDTKHEDSIEHDKSSASKLKHPYRGMRPYNENHKTIFFGRERVALQLRNKIISNKLTVLYAHSGVGKTSVLQTIVEPSLRDFGAKVIHFDRWSVENPILELIHEIKSIFENVKFDDNSVKDNALFSLAENITDNSDITLVFVFDQFEEFLIRHVQDLDPIRSEIAKIIRANSMQVHIVLSLRQDCLAGLEPFRETILNLFQSTYQLKDLNDKEIRRAIISPAEIFGFTIEKNLVDKLISDLSNNQPSNQIIDIINRIDLPPLQQVLLEIWKSAKKANISVLTLSRYEQLGGANKILDEYITTVMPNTWSKKIFTATLMKSLAPPSRSKQSYSTRDLCIVLDLNQHYKKIESELTRLSKVRILRTVKFSSSAETRYELQHDAFIEIISKWRNRVLNRYNIFKKLIKIMAILFAILIIPLIFIPNQLQYINNTEGHFERIKATEQNNTKEDNDNKELLLANAFDNSTSYLVSQADSDEKFEELKDFLLEHYIDMPEWYGLNRVGIDDIILPKNNWPFIIKYSKNRNVDEYIFNKRWFQISKFYAQEWGVPLYNRVHLKVVPHFQSKDIQIVNITHTKDVLEPSDNESQELLDTESPLISNYYLISKKYLPKSLNTLFNYFNLTDTNWQQDFSLEYNGPWWKIPRWSIPIFKVRGQTILEGKSYLADIILDKMHSDPKMLLTPAATEFLIQGIEKNYPQTVSEVRHSRGDKLRSDLIEIIKRRQSLLELPQIIDLLAQYPKMDSASIIDEIYLDLESNKINPSLKFNGVWQKNNISENKISEKLIAPFYDSGSFIPKPKKLINVIMGSKFIKLYIHENNLTDEIIEKTELNRDKMFKNYGIVLPGVNYDYFNDTNKKPNDFSIELLPGLTHYTENEIYNTNGNINNIIDKLYQKVIKYRIYWLTAESTQNKLNELPKKLRQWLLEHYSLTDLKLLFRAIIEPNNENSFESNSEPEGTLRHFEWLMRAIPYWINIDSSQSINGLASNLRLMQKQRIEKKYRNDNLNNNSIKMVAAINELNKDNFKIARQSFIRTIKLNSKSATEEFLSIYVANHESLIQEKISIKCHSPTSVTLSREERINLKSYLKSLELTAMSDESRQIKLCLLKNTPLYYIQNRKKLINELSQYYPNPYDWPMKEASWFTWVLFDNYNHLKESVYTEDLLKSFFNRILANKDTAKSNQEFIKLTDRCTNYSIDKWCWDLASTSSIDNNNYYVKLNLADLFSVSELPRELKLSLLLTSQAEKLIHSDLKIKTNDKSNLLDYTKYYRTISLINLNFNNINFDYTESEISLKSLITHKNLKFSVIYYLINIYLASERYSDAKELIDDAIKEYPMNISFNQMYLHINLLLTNISNIKKHAFKIKSLKNDVTGGYKKTDHNNKHNLYVEALTQILIQAPLWQRTVKEFIASDHDYVHYLTLMMYAYSDDKQVAKKLLQSKWESINTREWSQSREKRLINGDENVWREMLIGYYQNDIDENLIFQPLMSDENFKQSIYRNLTLAREGMLTEAYFYDAMLAKANNDIALMKSKLKKVIEIKYIIYSEYYMAIYLLDKIENETGNKK